MESEQTVDPGQRWILDSGAEIKIESCDKWGVTCSDGHYHLSESLVCQADEPKEQYIAPEKKPVDRMELWLAAMAYVKAAEAKERADKSYEVAVEAMNRLLSPGAKMVLKIDYEHWLLESTDDGFGLTKIEVY